MSTYKEIVSMVLDELKISSDDSYFTEGHVMYLLNKWRAELLKLRYAGDIKKPVFESNYQRLQFTLTTVKDISGDIFSNGEYYRTTEKVPLPMKFANTRVYTNIYFKGYISFVTKDRFRYVGENPYMKNIIYATINSDGYLYLTMFTPVNPTDIKTGTDDDRKQALTTIFISSVFEDADAASEFDIDGNADIMDRVFPLEDSMIPDLIGIVVKELRSALMNPEDLQNNENDELGDLVRYLHNNVKSNLSKQLSGE